MAGKAGAAKERGGGQNVEKMKIAELKDYLKSFKIPQNGEKEDLVLRVKLHLASRDMKIDSKDPFDMKPAELRKACAQRGLNPMGERDELLKLLIENEGGSSAVEGGEEDNEGVSLAKRVLELGEDHCGILSLLGENVTPESSPASMRKQYLLISQKIHPDKLPSFSQATKAFQLLVSAYDALTQPDMTKADVSKSKAKTINRSNDGCYRTDIQCPRCSAPWGEAIDGLEAAAYSHMMTGIKTYCCSTCLLDFGCMTAIHKCPFCRKQFDYSPDIYHEKITCGNKGCTKKFGFMLYNVSETRMKQLREELKAAQERRLKKQETLDRRHARAKEKGISVSVDSDEELKQQIKSFEHGLLNECPKCGWKLKKRDGEEEAKEHLKDCNDQKKISAYQRRKRIQKETEIAKASRRGQQEEVVNLRTWEFLGAENENLWMLSVEQLRKQCQSYKLEEDGDKDELIARLVRHRNSLDASRLLTDVGGEGDAKKPRRRIPTHQTLPSNLESLSLAQLKAVAASHGIEVKGTSKADVIRAIEKERFRDEPQLRLTMTAENEADEVLPAKRRRAAKKSSLDDDDSDDGGKRKRSKKSKKKSLDEDDEDDEEFVPDDE